MYSLPEFILSIWSDGEVVMWIRDRHLQRDVLLSTPMNRKGDLRDAVQEEHYLYEYQHHIGQAESRSISSVAERACCCIVEVRLTKGCSWIKTRCSTLSQCWLIHPSIVVCDLAFGRLRRDSCPDATCWLINCDEMLHVGVYLHVRSAEQYDKL